MKTIPNKHMLGPDIVITCSLLVINIYKDMIRQLNRQMSFQYENIVIINFSRVSWAVYCIINLYGLGLEIILFWSQNYRFSRMHVQNFTNLTKRQKNNILENEDEDNTCDDTQGLYSLD